MSPTPAETTPHIEGKRSRSLLTEVPRIMESWRHRHPLEQREKYPTTDSKKKSIAQSPNQTKQLARSFAKLMLEGKTKAALRLIYNRARQGRFPTSQQHCADKHSRTSNSSGYSQTKKSSESTSPSRCPPIPQTQFTQSCMITLMQPQYSQLHYSLRSQGTAGPSAIDACGWRQMCTSFQTSSDELCHSLVLALLAHRPCAEYVDPKRDFRDALALRYVWLPSQAPTHCACGKCFTVQHALSCPKGGFPIIRHNEVRDLTATLLTEVCYHVSIEPDLQSLKQLSGLWGGRYERALFDVKVTRCPSCTDNRKT